MRIPIPISRSGFKKDGTITAVKIDNIVAKMGQYGIDHFEDNTRIPNLLLNYVEAQANIAPAWWFRCEQNHNCFCFNAPCSPTWPMPQGMDPTEVALKNDGAGRQGHGDTFPNSKKSMGSRIATVLAEIIEKGKIGH